VHDRRVRIRVRDLPMDIDALAAQDGQRPPQAPFGLRMLGLGRIALRADDQEARRRTSRARLRVKK